MLSMLCIRCVCSFLVFSEHNSSHRTRLSHIHKNKNFNSFHVFFSPTIYNRSNNLLLTISKKRTVFSDQSLKTRSVLLSMISCNNLVHSLIMTSLSHLISYFKQFSSHYQQFSYFFMTVC